MDKRAKTSVGNLGQYLKPKWKSGKTVAIRVPVVIKDELLEVAKKLDDGSEDISKNDNIKDVVEKLRHAVTPKKDGGGYDGRKIKQLKTYVLEALEMLEEE